MQENQIDELKEQILLFRESSISITPSTIGRWRITLSPKVELGFGGLAFQESYRVLPYWEEDIGLVIYFSNTGKNEVVAYIVEESEDTTLKEKTHSHLITRAGNLEETRNYVRLVKGLGGLIQLWSDFYRRGQDQSTFLKEAIEQKAAKFRAGSFSIVSSGAGRWQFAPTRKNVLDFQRLSSQRIYRIVPYWEEEIGLRIYFVSDHETIAYSVDAYADYEYYIPRGKRGKEFSSSVQGRAKSLEVARNLVRIRELIRAQGNLKKLESADKTSQEQFEWQGKRQRIEKIIDSFNTETATVESSKTGKWALTVIDYNTLVFPFLTPFQSYRLMPVWKEDVGLVIYFIRDGETIGYTIDSYGDYDPRRKKQKTFYAWKKVRSTTTEECQEILRRIAWLHRTGNQPLVLDWSFSPDHWKFQNQVSRYRSPITQVLLRERIERIRKALSSLGISKHQQMQLIEIAQLMNANLVLSEAVRQIGVEEGWVLAQFELLRNVLQDFAPEEWGYKVKQLQSQL